MDQAAIQQHRLRQFVDDALRNLTDTQRVFDIDQNDGEFITADPRNRIALTHGFQQHLGRVLQQFVTNGMTVIIVNMLEIVEVEQQ